MTQSGGSIDREWNIWKQAAQVIERERELWRYHPIADEFQAVQVKLMQLGYLPEAERRRILALIDKAEP